MTRDIIVGVFEIAFGGLLAAHCPRAALRELRSGVARGRVNNFRRERDPVAFWMTIGATALAGVMGAVFFVLGLSAVAVGAGLIR